MSRLHLTDVLFLEFWVNVRWVFGMFVPGGSPYPDVPLTQEFYSALKRGYRMDRPEHAPQSMYDTRLRILTGFRNDLQTPHVLRLQFWSDETLLGGETSVKTHFLLTGCLRGQHVDWGLQKGSRVLRLGCDLEHPAVDSWAVSVPALPQSGWELSERWTTGCRSIQSSCWPESRDGRKRSVNKSRTLSVDLLPTPCVFCRIPSFSGGRPPIRGGGGGQGEGRTSPWYLHHPSPCRHHRDQSWLCAGRREVRTWTDCLQGLTLDLTSDNSIWKIQNREYIICNLSPQPSDSRFSGHYAGSDIIAAQSGSWRDSCFLQQMWGRGELTVTSELPVFSHPFVKRSHHHQTLPAWVIMPTVLTAKGHTLVPFTSFKIMFKSRFS